MNNLTWKSVDFFTDIIVRDLALEEGDSFTVSRFHIGNATDGTAGYMSLIHRVSIDVEFGMSDRKHSTLSYIVKEKSDQTFGGKLVEVMAVFPKEREVYEKLLPCFERFFEGNEPVRFGPKMYKATNEPFTVIVMEDLSRRQFSMPQRRFGLPMADVQSILRKLAKFHAASVIYRENYGAYSEHFSGGVIAERTIDMLRGHYEFLYGVFVQSLRDRNFPMQYLQPLVSLEGRLLQECCKAQRADESEFRVLNHGDLWPNNVMFGNGDVLLLDFQTAFYGSFAADILYFFVTSATELLCDSFEELFQFYYKNLVVALKQLNYGQSIPTYDELLRQIKRRGVLMLPPLSEAVAITMAGVTDPSDMEMITSENPEGVVLRNRVYNNPTFVSLVDGLIPKLFEIKLFTSP